MAAQSQWASGYTEHDWRVSVGANYYGLLQQVVYTTDLVHGYRTTTLYFGTHSWLTTRFRADYAAVVALVVLGIAGVLSSKNLLINKRTHDPAA